MHAAKIQVWLALTLNNGWMAPVRIHAATTTFVQQIQAVLQIVCAMITLMIANASTDTTSLYSKPNAFVIYGAYGS